MLKKLQNRYLKLDWSTDKFDNFIQAGRRFSNVDLQKQIRQSLVIKKHLKSSPSAAMLERFG